MTTFIRRRRALPLALTLTGALVCVGLVALPAEAAAPAQKPTVETGKLVSVPSAKAVSKKRSTQVPVWVTLGGGSNVSGAKVRVFDSKGTVVATATTNAGGVAMVKRADLPSGNFTIKASGGKKLASVGASQLIARGSLPANATRVLYVSPVTTTAYQVAAKQGISYGTAVNKVKTSLSMPIWASAGQFSTLPAAFDSAAFLAWAKKNGGVTKATGLLANAAGQGTQLANFAENAGPKTRAKQNRGVTTTVASTVGKALLGQVVQDVAPGVEQELGIGNIFGSDPTAAGLSEINADLIEISNQLYNLQQSMNELITLELESQYDTLAASMNTVVGNTANAWALYNTATTLNPAASDYDATIQEYASDFNADLSPYMGQFNALFTTSGVTGVLAALYSENNAAWWNSDDITSIDSTIDYYGTVFAEAVALLNESWSAPGATNKTSDYVSSENNTIFQPMSNNIYYEAPTMVGTNAIIDPKAQTMYQLQAATVQEVWENNSRGNGENPSCNSKGSTLNAATESWPKVQPSGTNWASLWQNKLGDKSWTVTPSSEFGFLAQSRTINGSKQYTLDTLKTGAPSGWVMVGSDTQPIGGFQQVSGVYNSGYEFVNFMWCYSTSVSLVTSTDSSWEYNVATDTSGHDTYPGTAAVWGTAAPVGILNQKQGNFAYRTPPSSVKVS